MKEAVNIKVKEQVTEEELEAIMTDSCKDDVKRDFQLKVDLLKKDFETKVYLMQRDFETKVYLMQKDFETKVDLLNH